MILISKSSITLKALVTLTMLFISLNSLADTLKGFTSICTLEENCSIEGSALVAFGSNGHYTYRTLTGNFLCTGSTFGLSDPKIDTATTCLSINSEPAQTMLTTNQRLNQAKSEHQLSSGLYAIVSAHSQKALTVANGASVDDTLLIQREFTHQDNQLWQVKKLENGFYSLLAQHNGKALETEGWSLHDGAKLQQYSWINSLNQHWEIAPVTSEAFQISSRVNGQSIDLFGMNKNDYGEVFLWTYWGGLNQQWLLLPIDELPSKKQP